MQLLQLWYIDDAVYIYYAPYCTQYSKADFKDIQLLGNILNLVLTSDSVFLSLLHPSYFILIFSI